MKAKYIFITIFILVVTVFSGCTTDSSNTLNSERVITTLSSSIDNTEITSSTKTEDVEDALGFYDVVFGEYGLEINVSGNMEYIEKIQEANYTYLFDKTRPGEIYLTPELEAVMGDGNDESVYAVHIIGFAADSSRENPEFADITRIKDMIKNKDLTFAEFKSNVAVGEVFFLTATEINELSCDDDVRLVCGSAVYTDVYENIYQPEFNDKLDLLSAGDTVPVYVYYNAFSDIDISETDIDTDLYTNIDRANEYVEIYHNRVNNSAFQEYLTNGAVLNGLRDLVKAVGIDDSNVIYTPALSRLQAYMTVEQINEISESCKIAIRCD